MLMVDQNLYDVSVALISFDLLINDTGIGHMNIHFPNGIAKY